MRYVSIPSQLGQMILILLSSFSPVVLMMMQTTVVYWTNLNLRWTCHLPPVDKRQNSDMLNLMLSMLGKNFSRHFGIFFCRNWLRHFMHIHTCHKLWTKICEIKQTFKGDSTKFCESFLLLTSKVFF